MRLPVVSRNRHERVLRDMAADLTKTKFELLRLQRDFYYSQSLPKPKPKRWPSVLAGIWLVVIGVVVGGAAVPHIHDRPTLSTVPACISKARYEHPIADNQYQELVNALYSCEVYK